MKTILNPVLINIHVNILYIIVLDFQVSLRKRQNKNQHYEKGIHSFFFNCIFAIYMSHEMYDNWLVLTIFLSPPKKKRKEKKENEVAKPVLNHFFI